MSLICLSTQKVLGVLLLLAAVYMLRPQTEENVRLSQTCTVFPVSYFNELTINSLKTGAEWCPLQ